MAKSKGQPAGINVEDTTRPETDYEHSQRYLNDIDRSTWTGNHAPPKGPRAIVHRLSTAEHTPHIFKAGN